MLIWALAHPARVLLVLVGTSAGLLLLLQVGEAEDLLIEGRA